MRRTVFLFARAPGLSIINGCNDTKSKTNGGIVKSPSIVKMLIGIDLSSPYKNVDSCKAATRTKY